MAAGPQNLSFCLTKGTFSIILALFIEDKSSGLMVSLEQEEISNRQVNSNSRQVVLNGMIFTNASFIYPFLFNHISNSTTIMATAMVTRTMRAATPASPPAGILSDREAS